MRRGFYRSLHRRSYRFYNSFVEWVSVSDGPPADDEQHVNDNTDDHANYGADDHANYSADDHANYGADYHANYGADDRTVDDEHVNSDNGYHHVNPDNVYDHHDHRRQHDMSGKECAGR